MNHEQEMCSPAEHENRAAPPPNDDLEQQPSDVGSPENRAAISERAPNPATRQERKLLERLHTVYGAAFEVYLDRIWRGTPITDMEADFLNLYWASYDTPEQFSADGIDAHGWKDAIEEVMHHYGIPKQFLRWDYHAAMRTLGTDFEFHERGGRLHAFIR